MYDPLISPTLSGARGKASGLVAVLDRACSDCHSNGTVWPWYTQIAPMSWLMAYGVTKRRKAVNFSEWAAYPPEQQRILLALSCQDASEGKMPGPYTLLHPETQLSAQDVETICAAARWPKRTRPTDPEPAFVVRRSLNRCLARAAFFGYGS